MRRNRLSNVVLTSVSKSERRSTVGDVAVRDLAAAVTTALHDRPVAVDLAVFATLAALQEHGGSLPHLAARRIRGRSGLHALGLGKIRRDRSGAYVAQTPENSGFRWRVAEVGLTRACTPAQLAAVVSQTAGRVSFFLFTDNFARDHAAYLAAGVVFREAPRYEPYGTVAVVEDLYGPPWDLIQPPTR
jgi:hypothetical protein